MRPTQPLFKRLKTRLRFTTKQVGKGFYRGNNVGSLGAHTRTGDYLIDWRKVRHYVVPNLKDAKLTPFVSGQIPKHEKLPDDPSGKPYDRVDGMQYLKWWKEHNANDYDFFLDDELKRQAQEEATAAAEEQASLATQTAQTAQPEQPTR